MTSLAAATLAAGALVAGAPSAGALPPGEWTNESFYEFGTASWALHGSLTGKPGNWHTGYVDVEADDDWITGGTYDWWCPIGSTPPVWDPGPKTACVLKHGVRLQDNVSMVTVSFDENAGEMSVQGQVGLIGEDNTLIRRVPISLVWRGLGTPTETLVDSGTYAYYDKIWSDSRIRGRIGAIRTSDTRNSFDGHRVGFWWDGVRASS